MVSGLLPGLAAAESGFSDVPQDHPAYSAIVYLRDQGMVKGYSDGTFKPNQQVDRAAAVKMILAGQVTEEQAAAAAANAPAFADMPKDAWYRGWVAEGVKRGFIDGPAKKPNFEGGRAVNLAEFLKMLNLAQGMDPNAYGEITLPLATDVTDKTAWFYPYFRLALSTSVVMADDASQLHPTMTLTRGDVAMLVYRLLMYKQKRRTQALLSLAESELTKNVLPNLNAEKLPYATMGYARALLASRGALTSRPDTPIVQGAVKVTQAFGALIAAYDAGVRGDLEATITNSGEAYSLAEQAKTFSPDLASITDNIQKLAHDMAEEARTLQSQPQ